MEQNELALEPFLSRRDLITSTLAGGAMLLACGPVSAAPSQQDSGAGVKATAQPEFPAPFVQLFTNGELNFEALFALGAVGLCSEAGEVLTAVRAATKAGAGPDGYYTAFRTLADRVAKSASEARPVTARARYLRAAKYYAQALFVVLGSSTPNEEEEVYLKMKSAWSKVAALNKPAWQKVSIPYEGSDLPGWFCPSPQSGKRPTLILTNGSDGQNPDILPYGLEAGLARGYNVLLYDGPGQGEMLFLRKIPFRSDWEAVVTPLVDYLLTRPEVDPARIALSGWSMGGNLVARAAAYENRLAAVVSDTGLISPWLAFPQELREVAQAGDAEIVNRIWAQEVIAKAPAYLSYYMAKRFSIFSTQALVEARAGKAPSDFYGLAKAIESFSLTPAVLSKIACPYLVIDYEGETFYAGQPKRFYDALSCPKTFHKFTDAASLHCAPMAPGLRNEMVFGWLDDKLGL